MRMVNGRGWAHTKTHWPAWCVMAKILLNVMNNSTMKWPSVPGVLTIPVLGSKQVIKKVEGAKNLRVRCQGFYFCTFNCRSLGSEDRILELEEELQHIKWDVIGLSEVRRKGEELIELKSGNMLYYKGTNDGRCGGIGFLVNKELKNKIVKVSSISDRVGKLTIRLSKRYQAEIIQVYAPTASYDDEEVEKFYEDVQKTLNDTRKHQLRIIMGDFNARIGIKRQNENAVGNFGAGERDDRGHRLVEFAECEKFYIMNSFFKKNPKKKWTWRSPNGGTSELDYILVNKKNTIDDCAVINRFHGGSDHRLVRCKINFKVGLERRKLLESSTKRLNLQNLVVKKEEFQLELRNRFAVLHDDLDNINTFTSNFTQIILGTAEATAGTTSEQNIKKISEKTRQLLTKRREMKYKKENLTSKIEYTELCKTIRKCIVNDTRNFNCTLIKNTIEENRSLKATKRSLAVGKKRILALKRKDGTVSKSQDEILKIAEDFYAKLYSGENRPLNNNRTCINSEENNKGLEILKEEVRQVIKCMKKGKAAGEDQISIDILKETGDETSETLARLFNLSLQQQDIPEDWKNAIVILLFKKGDKENIKNYRPISLLSVLYKILTKILTNRIQGSLDAAQPKEQAGFRSGFSTIDHIHTIREVIERSNE